MNTLQVIISESNLEEAKAQSLLEQFQGYMEIAQEWEARAKTIVVTDETQTDAMKLARTGRLLLREKRVAIERRRKELKESALREGQAIDKAAKFLKGLIEPIELYLDQQEHFVEIREKAKADAIEAARIEAERIAEEERIAAEKAEQERIRQEVEALRVQTLRLQVEAEKQAAELEAERRKSQAAAETLKQQFASQITCPNCGHKFTPDREENDETSVR